MTYLSGFDITVVAIGDSVNSHIFEDYGKPCDYFIRYKNLPVGDKWNTGLRMIKEIDLDFDYILISGSDDIYSASLFQRYFKLMAEGVHFVGLLDFYFYDIRKGVLKYFGGHHADRKGETQGAGRLLHRNVLDALEWELWDDHRNSELDLSLTRRLDNIGNLKRRVINLRAEGLVAVDIKDGENIHSIEKYRGKYVDKDILREVNLMELV